MKYFALVALAFISLASCKAKKAAIDTDTLPKDISLKPERTFEDDNKNLEAMKAEIEKLISSETCTDASQWRISPIGSKPCGGPSAYVAYPINLESEILPKIKNYSEAVAQYNKKRGLVSDCALVAAPSGIKCENGKAVLIGGNSASEIQ